MKFFNLISEPKQISSSKKVIPASDFSEALEGKELLEKIKVDAAAYKEKVVLECEQLKEQAVKDGFNEGMKVWSEQIAFLKQEITSIRKQIEGSIVPLALASTKKIIGKEIELHPNVIISIIEQALKTVSQNKHISIYVNGSDLKLVEQFRNQFKQQLEYIETFIIAERKDVSQGGCIIETEVGIINAQLEAQLSALEKAFKEILRSSTEVSSSENNDNHK